MTRPVSWSVGPLLAMIAPAPAAAVPGQATDPTPAHLATDVDTNVDLTGFERLTLVQVKLEHALLQ